MTQPVSNTLFRSKDISVDVLRLDLLHPQVSGNKWFKLKYYLADATDKNKKGMVSFGGAYSNHLVAMAFACAQQGLSSAGIIRGDEGALSNPSLEDMKKYGMNLSFVSREDYRKKDKLIENFLSRHPEYYDVPEGGSGEKGIKGAAEILHLADDGYSHIACAVGTGTTFAGLINAAGPDQQVLGIYCVKVPGSDSSIATYVQAHAKNTNYQFISGYEFGGFGKKNETLTAFMNHLYEEEKIPTDFVYTGKLFYALYDLVNKDFFEPGSRILVIHSGGLQGNRSLKQGELQY